MTVTRELIHRGLIAAGSPVARADELAALLLAAMERRSITTPARAAAYLGQLGHESGGFVRMEENLNYQWRALRRVFRRYYLTDIDAQMHHRKPVEIANRVYGGRLGNREPGDGWRYRGRGFIQLTGRANYAEAGAALGLPLEDDPDRLLHNAEAAEVAAWWWQDRGCNALADAGDFEALTRRINGGLHGLEDRLTRWRKVRRAWGLD